MSQYDDDNDSDEYSESEDTDPMIRELRSEIVRLEAQLDQLTASVRERAAETAEIRVRLTELEEALTRLEARRRRDEKLIILAWVMVAASLALSVYTYLTM